MRAGNMSLAADSLHNVEQMLIDIKATTITNDNSSASTDFLSWECRACFA